MHKRKLPVLKTHVASDVDSTSVKQKFMRIFVKVWILQKPASKVELELFDEKNQKQNFSRHIPFTVTKTTEGIRKQALIGFNQSYFILASYGFKKTLRSFSI